MLDFELRAEFHDHSVIEIGTVVCDISFGDTIPPDKVMLNESGNNILSNRGKRGWFNPLCEVINGDEDEAMTVESSRFNLSNHINSPHYEWTRSSQYIHRNWRNMNFISIGLALMTSSRVMMTIFFHGRPIITCL